MLQETRTKFSCMLLFFLFFRAKAINQNFSDCIPKIATLYAKGIIISVFDKNASEIITVQEIPLIGVSSKQIFRLEKIQGKADMLLLNVGNMEELNATLNEIFYLKLYDARMKVIALINEEDQLEMAASLLWSYHLYNVLLILKNGQQEVFYKMHFTNCGSNVFVRKIGTCENILVENPFSVFMHKNLKKCTLLTLWAYCTPWIMDPHKDDPPGLLIMFLKELVDSLDLSVEFAPRDEKYRIEIQESYSFFEVRNDFDRGYGDIFLGLGTNNEFLYENFYTTFPIIDESVIWIVPRTGKVSSWELLTIIYSKEQWFSLFSVVAIMVVLCRFFGKSSGDRNFSRLGQCWVYVVSLILGISSRFHPKLPRVRFLLTTFLFFCFMVTLFAQARIFSLLTQPQYGKQIENLDDLLESNMPLIFETGMSVLFLFYGPKFQKVFDTYIPTNETLDNNIITFLKKRNYATIANKAIFISHPQLRKHVNIFDVIYFHCVTLVRNNHVLFESLNTRLKQLIEAGLVVKLTDDLKHTFNLNCYKDASECYLEEEGVGPLKMTYFHAALNFFALGIGLSVIAFAFEVITGVVRKKFAR